MEKATLEAATIKETIDDIQRIKGKLDSATIGQLETAAIGLCGDIVQLTTAISNEDACLIAALYILEEALDENGEADSSELQHCLVSKQE